MKTPRPSFLRRLSAGFTLVEMIGVMAILAIMAGILTPNVLRSIERASVVAEQQTLGKLGGQVKKYLHDYGFVPAVGTWDTNIATYSEVSVLDIRTNKRQNNRVYLLDPDPAAPQERAIILSSMRAGMALPTSANINTALRFAALWDTVDGQVPSAVSWGGWTAQAAEYLIIERINFKSEYRTIVLQNTSNVLPAIPASVSYGVQPPQGPLQPGVTIIAGGSTTLRLVPNMRLNLYLGTTPATGIDYSYVVNTTPKKFDFNGSHWIPQ